MRTANISHEILCRQPGLQINPVDIGRQNAERILALVLALDQNFKQVINVTAFRIILVVITAK